MKILFLIFLGLFSCSEVETARQGQFVTSDPEASGQEIYLDATFTLIFSEKFKIESFTSQASNGPCKEENSVMLSSDDFGRCFGGTITETADGSGRRVIFTPISELPAETEFILKLKNTIEFVELENLNEVELKFITGTELTPSE